MRIFREVILFLLLIAVQYSTAQTTLVPTTGSDTLLLAPGTSATILDPGGNGDYPDNCNGRLIIISSGATALTFSGYSFTDNNNDFLYLYDGSTLLATLTGVRPLNYTAVSGSATLHFVSDHNSSRMGFVATVAACPLADEQVQNIIVSPITNHAATITFSDSSNATQWTLCYGTSPYSLNHILTTSVHSITIGGLDEYTRYFFRLYRGNHSSDDSCAAPPHSFRTPCSTLPTACIDYSNLHSCYVRCSYGDYLNPDQNSGIIDSGSTSAASRHTIHTDTAERDPRTGNLLRTVPEGHSSSVRLGNWTTGGQAESITYEYTVDTNAGGLLIMKYAAILQDPNHTVTEQPRFTFQILDSAMHQLDATCYSANFIAGSSLGWNSYDPGNGGETPSPVLWKDWTSVGIDLTPLHGQTIYIKLSTYDCARSDHYAYAYFVFHCTPKTIIDQDCGAAPTHTFTAPDGFSYLWYKSDNPTDTIATTRTATVSQQGEYRCTMQFLGAPPSANCSFQLVAIASERYPAARIVCDTLDHVDCNQRILLTDSSFISSDSAHLFPMNGTPDRRLWIVDGDSTSTSNQLILTLTPGWHTISLVATLAGGNCNDTATLPLFIKAICPVYAHIDTTICQNQLPWTFLDSTITTDILDTSTAQFSIFNFQFSIPTSHGADSIITMQLTVLHNTYASVNDTIVQNQLPYTIHPTPYTSDDSTITSAMLDTGTAQFSILNSQFSIPNSLGCDSLIDYSLLVWHNVNTHIDTTICQNQLPFIWNNDTIITASDTLHPTPYTGIDTGTAQFSIFNSQFSTPTSHGADSTIHLTLTVLHNTYATVNDTIVQNQLPYTIHLTPYTSDDSTITTDILDTGTAQFSIFNSQFSTPNSLGCDSLIDYSLLVWHNVDTHIDTTICDNQLPFIWHNDTLHPTPYTLHPTPYTGIDTGTAQFSIFNFQFSTPNSHGADSTIHLTLTVNPTYESFDTVTLCRNQLPYIWNDTIIRPPSELTDSAQFSIFNSQFSIPTIHGCDSLLHLNLTVNPTYDIHLYDTICDNQLPFIWHNDTLHPTPYTLHPTPYTGIDTGTAQFSIFNFQFSIPTLHGCDSTTTLHLTVHPTSRHYDYASFCNGQPYTWKDGNTYHHTTYQPSITYTDQNGCDSVIQLILNLDHSFHAAMRITPTVVTPDQPQVQLQDLSNSSSRQWYALYPSTDPALIDTAQLSFFNYQFSIPDADSVSILLVAQNLAGCIDSLWQVVHTDPSALWVPNAFTPDATTNQLFLIPTNHIDGGEVWIYTRQGLLVTHFDIIGGSWDGTHNGQACPQGTYTWVLRYRTSAQPRLQRQAKGTVTLLR